MSQTLTIQLNDVSFALVAQAAQQAGKPPSLWAAEFIEEQIAANVPRSADASGSLTPEQAVRQQKLAELIGSVDLGHPIGIQNDQIDHDLAREYGHSH